MGVRVCPSGKARSWGVSDLSTRFATLGGRTAIYFHCSIKSRHRSIWGCDWQNVPLLLPHTFTAYERLTNSKHVQVAMLGEHGIAWPWESLHIEALAWFDHWMKGQDTGILDGPSFRYILPESEGWRTTDA